MKQSAYATLLTSAIPAEAMLAAIRLALLVLGSHAGLLIGMTGEAWAQSNGGGNKRPPDRDLVVVDRATVTRTGQVTSIHLGLTARLVPKVATLSSPYRVVVDFPRAAFRLAPGVGKRGAGLISAFRYGLLTPQSSRMVIDAAGPFSIKALRILGRANGRTDLVLEMIPVPEGEFSRQGQSPDQSPKNVASSALRKGQFEHRNRKARRQPVVVIDPGHGGLDPGAISKSNTYEKTIVLAVARQLRKRLQATKRFQVIMTRTRDIFVSLDARVRLSRKVGADLFVSLHADATERAAAEVRGASIYTLSKRASDEQARLFAQKENASDVLAGFSITRSGTNDSVGNILFDLLNRETQIFSYRAQQSIIASLRGKVVLAGDPRRAAAFKVLKQTGTPSVLIELGYVSNRHDEREMLTRAWQRKVAKAIARAIDGYFKKTDSVMRR